MKITYIDFFKLLIKHRKLLLADFLIFFILGIAISLIIPQWYKASSTILPPTSNTQNIRFSNLLNNLPLGSLGLNPTSEDINVYIAILNSRRIMEMVAKQFNLINLYHRKNMEETVRELRQHANFKLNEEGTLTISFEASTGFFPNSAKKLKAGKLSAKITNAFVKFLDNINKKLKNAQARNNRIYIERRYQQNQEDLKNAENKLKDLQNKYGIIFLPDQLTEEIKKAADIKAMIMQKEIEIGLLEQTVSKSNSDLIKTKMALREYQKKYKEFITGSKVAKNILGGTKRTDDIFLPLINAPNLTIKYGRLLRDVEIQQKIMEFLLPQYEQAKIEEVKNLPTILILDKAIQPIKKYKPRRAFLVIFFSITMLLLSIVIIVIYEYYNKIIFILKNN